MATSHQRDFTLDPPDIEMPGGCTQTAGEPPELINLEFSRASGRGVLAYVNEAGGVRAISPKQEGRRGA